MNILSSVEIDELLRNRDERMHIVDVATEVRKKQLKAKTPEEFDAISIPRIFPFNYQEVFVERTSSRNMPEFAQDVMMDMFCRGLAMQREEGSVYARYGNLGAVGVIDLYRGELMDYGSQCTSTLGRYIKVRNKDDEFTSKAVDFFIEQMRIYCFCEFLSIFKQVSDFQIATPLRHIIAQHYGLKTQFLDLTDDLKVALFFACCKHIGNNKYRPITKDDLADLGNYGVLYHGLKSNREHMIGYQPFTRCHNQRGYYIDTSSERPCWDFELSSTSFTKSLFERTPELSRKLYDEFNGGKDLFPEDSLFSQSETIDGLMKNNKFPRRVFDKCVEILNNYLKEYERNNLLESHNDEKTANKMDAAFLEKAVSKKGIMIVDDGVLIPMSRESIDALESCNRQWDINKFIEREGIITWGRGVIPSDNGGFWLSRTPCGGVFTTQEEQDKTSRAVSLSPNQKQMMDSLKD